jgi:hypothetical protein
MKYFEQKKSLAGVMQPGDGTRYEFVAVKLWDCVEVIVQNDAFFDKIVFIPSSDEPCTTFRNERTNPWTVKAAREMRDLLLNEDLLVEALRKEIGRK